MIELSITTTTTTYPILVENGLFERAAELITSHLAPRKKVALITDSHVEPLYAKKLQQDLSDQQLEVSLHVVPAGEASKSMEQVSALASQLNQAGHNRKSFVIALGGGVVGDLAGFVAAIFYRGIPFVQIPTTIVSQVDSSVGGKTGVNTPEGKNLIGCFHQPQLVLIDPLSLQTLDSRQYRAGMAEAIKHAAIANASMLETILSLRGQVPASSFLADNLSIKAAIVQEDEKETTGTRALLNFGHTLGHAIEASLPYGELLHGEAIALGMRAALFLSQRHAGLSSMESQRILQAIACFELPLVLPQTISQESILEKYARDKKFGTTSRPFVLLASLGKALLSEKVTPSDVLDAIALLRTAP